MDLFLRYGYIAAAGDRHLAEFCRKKWYLDSPERVKEMHFGLTGVKSRKETLKSRLENSRRLVSGEKPFEFCETGEDGVKQIRALLGLRELVTNVNMPNRGQISNLPMGVVVETNAVFCAGMVTPVLAGEIPMEIYPMMAGLAGEQEMTVCAGLEQNLDAAFRAFIQDPLTDLSLADAKELFDKMIENTKEYLKV